MFFRFLSLVVRLLISDTSFSSHQFYGTAVHVMTSPFAYYFHGGFILNSRIRPLFKYAFEKKTPKMSHKHRRSGKKKTKTTINYESGSVNGFKNIWPFQPPKPSIWSNYLSSRAGTFDNFSKSIFAYHFAKSSLCRCFTAPPPQKKGPNSKPVCL